MNTERIISPTEALKIAEVILREYAIRGMQPFKVSSSDFLNVEFKRVGGVGCDLSIGFSTGDRKPVYARRGNEVVDHAWVQRLDVKVCWSSTGRSVASATAHLALYREVVELAALIESRLAQETVGWSEKASVAEASR
jgi:hypothetical protein